MPEQNGMRVLVVDDDRLVAYSLSKMLKLHGYSVRTASSGGDALALVPEFRPQAILLDIGLVGMDGFETARRLRSLPGGDGYRLIAVSGYGDEAALERSKVAGFDAYLIKPVDYRRLAAELSLVDA
jgi:CheY-like chemotaxis protein